MLSLRLITLFAVALAGSSLAQDERLPNMITVNMSGYMYCVGTVISKNRVLIPAMCASSGGSSITVGDRSGNVPFYDSGRLYSIINIKFHPDRDYMNQANEYAILTVDRAIDAGKDFTGAELAKDDVEIPEGSIGTTIRRASSMTTTPVSYPWTPLEYQIVKVNNGNACKEMFLDRWTDDYICAEPADTSDINNPYSVESGAPLVVDGQIVGIAACNMGCYGTTLAFRRISTLGDFIAQ